MPSVGLEPTNSALKWLQTRLHNHQDQLIVHLIYLFTINLMTMSVIQTL